MRGHTDLFLSSTFTQRGYHGHKKGGSLRSGGLGVFLYVLGQKLSWDEVTAETGVLTTWAIKVLVYTSALNQVLSPRYGNFPFTERVILQLGRLRI